MPGGGGALAASKRDVIRAQQLRRECLYLVELHDIDLVLLLFHGPTPRRPVGGNLCRLQAQGDRCIASDDSRASGA